MPVHLALGGGLGALARFGLGGWLSAWAGVGFPWPTFVINLTGSLLLGFLNGRFARVATSPESRAFLAIGLCGGFTTFSTFDHETLGLLQQGRYLLAATYSSGSVITCMAGVIVGMGLAARWTPRLAGDR
jgi:fluoride exporter